MTDVKNRKEWKCVSCGHIFLPKPPNFSCPQCRSNATSPTYKIPLSEPSVQDNEKEETDANNSMIRANEILKNPEIINGYPHRYRILWGISATDPNNKNV